MSENAVFGPRCRTTQVQICPWGTPEDEPDPHRAEDPDGFPQLVVIAGHGSNRETSPHKHPGWGCFKMGDELKQQGIHPTLGWLQAAGRPMGHRTQYLQSWSLHDKDLKERWFGWQEVDPAFR